MKHIKRTLALVALATIGLLGTRSAEAPPYYHARDAAWAYCSLQSVYGLQCTVIEYGHGCGCGCGYGPEWVLARVFSDGYVSYAACTHHW